MNRLTNRYSTGNPNFAMINENSAYTPTGQRLSMTDGSGTTTYSYDNRDRLIQKIVIWNSSSAPTASLNYRYDANGNLTNLWSGYANGVNLAYGYDALNRLTNVLSHSQLAAGYAYDALGNLQALRYGNGVTNLYQYDSLNRLTNLVWELNNNPVASFAYQLKTGGTRTNLSEVVNGTSRTSQWQYDGFYRLTNEVVSGIGNVGYRYDMVGNRTNRQSTISQLPTANSSYDTNDWLTTDTYDNNGNTTASGGNTYQYDALNRLVATNGYAFQFAYDGDGIRVKKQVNYGLTTYYLVDDRNPSGYAQVLEEYQSLNSQPSTLNRVYNWGLALINQQQIDTNTLLPSTLSYYGYDGHGSVRFLTSTNGTITDTYTYDAYGTLISQTFTGSQPTPNNYLYVGQQFDPDLGFYYLRARYLNPNTGRFWTMDTYAGNHEDPLSLHKYLYCQNNPVNGVDPSGNDGELEELELTGDMTAGWDMMGNLSTSKIAFNGATCGPDITIPLKATLSDVTDKFLAQSKWQFWWIGQIGMFDPIEIDSGWDITALYSIGRGKMDNTLGGRRGAGQGYRTVQYSHQSGPLKVYWAGAVNYALWGHMFSLYHGVFPNDQRYSLSTALFLAKSYKIVASLSFGYSQSEIDSAMAFIKMGYDNTDPSSVALPIPSDPNNIAKPILPVLEWQFLSLRGG